MKLDHSMFKGRHFDQSVILLYVRWYLTYNLSLRNMKEMMAERGITMDHSTQHRWVLHFSPLLLERFNRKKRLSGTIVHTDRGAHYRWPGWLSRISDAKMVRSMSRKGCSQDNATCEGFFG